MIKNKNGETFINSQGGSNIINLRELALANIKLEEACFYVKKAHAVYYTCKEEKIKKNEESKK